MRSIRDANEAMSDTRIAMSTPHSKVDSSARVTYRMVLAHFSFQEVVLGRFFLTLSDADIGLQRRILFGRVPQSRGHAFWPPPGGLSSLIEANLRLPLLRACTDAESSTSPHDR